MMIPSVVEEVNVSAAFLDIELNSTAIGINDDRLSFFGTCMSLTKQRRSRGNIALACKIICLMHEKIKG